MDSNQPLLNLLLAIMDETKRSFESPVILITMKDYAEIVVNLLLAMRSALMQAPDTSQVTDIVSTFHFEWVKAVNDIEAFRKRARDTPREHINDAIQFSIQCASKRCKRWQKILNKTSPVPINPENAEVFQNDIITLSQMNENLTSSLRDKQTTFSMIVDPTEYNLKVLDETDELLNWLDYLNDNLAIQFSKIIGFKTELIADLTKILQEIVNDIDASSHHEIKPEQEKNSGEQDDTKNSEEEAIRGKIKDLEERTERLKNKDPSVVTALKHKTMYYKDRLQSLENLKISLLHLRNKSDSGRMLGTVHIFEHLLSPHLRCRLVETLLIAWVNAIVGPVPENSNIISILSVTDMKAMFGDGVGTCSREKFGDNIYIQHDGNKDTQLSEGEKHEYFYDERGRYYFNELNERIYETLTTASEPCRVKEEFLKATEYLYVNLSDYSLRYQGTKGGSGRGNLVRNTSEHYVECPREPSVSESSDYLKRVVGTALKKCLAQVLLRQPEDAVKFLAKSLEDYRINEQRREARSAGERALVAEREARMREAHEASAAPASPSSGERELSNANHNFVNYKTIDGDKL